MKGQQKIFEELLAFSLGLGLATMLLAMFNNISNTIGNYNEEKQLRDVGNLITSMIVMAYESGENTTLVMKIPTLINKKTYYIEANEKRLKLYTNKKMYEIETNGIDVEGKIISSSWYVRIRNDGNIVHIERWEG